MTARIFVDLMMGFPALHSKITHLAIESGIGGNETQTISEIRKNEVIDPQVTLGTAEVSELLVFGQEGTVETCGNSIEKDFPRKLSRYRMGAIRTARGIQQPTGDRFR